MLIIDLLDKKTKEKLKVKPTKSRAKRKRYKPPKIKQLSRQELEELMGVKRDTYKRVNGAVRSKR